MTIPRSVLTVTAALVLAAMVALFPAAARAQQVGVSAPAAVEAEPASGTVDAPAEAAPGQPPPAPPAAPFNPYLQTPGGVPAPPAEGTVVPPTSQGAPQGYVTYKTPWEVYLTAAAIVVLGLTLGMLAYIGRGGGLTPEFIRAFILVTIIFAALFLIAAGYSDEQAAPVYGLLGTILGYLFGRSDRKDETVAEAPGPPAATGTKAAGSGS